MATALKETAIMFDSFKYKHLFRNIQIKDCCGLLYIMSNKQDHIIFH